MRYLAFKTVPKDLFEKMGFLLKIGKNLNSAIRKICSGTLFDCNYKTMMDRTFMFILLDTTDKLKFRD